MDRLSKSGYRRHNCISVRDNDFAVDVRFNWVTTLKEMTFQRIGGAEMKLSEPQNRMLKAMYAQHPRPFVAWGAGEAKTMWSLAMKQFVKFSGYVDIARLTSKGLKYCREQEVK